MSLSFSRALEALQNGSCAAIQRGGWNGPGQAVRMQVPDEHSKMTSPYCYIQQADGSQPFGYRKTPWVPSQGDLFAFDWNVI